MKKDRGFASRIKTLYEREGRDAGDLRSQELRTMFDLFLGKTYDKRRKLEIARVQENLHNKQERLSNKLQSGGVSAEDYISTLNSLIGEAFAECRRILGPKDLKRLFGATHTKRENFVDRSAFLEGPRDGTAATSSATGPRDKKSSLSHREKKIMQLVAQGYPYKEIGKMLLVSEQTLKNHLQSILNKVGISGRNKLARYAIRHLGAREFNSKSGEYEV